MRWDLDKAKFKASLVGYSLENEIWRGVKYIYTFTSYHGFKWKCTWDNFYNKGCRCPRDTRPNFFIETIRPSFEELGYKILLDPLEYEGQFQRFYFICDLGLYYETCWNNISRKGINNFSSKLYSYKELKNYIKKKGGRILQPWYLFKGVDVPVRYKCKHGHINFISLSKSRSGSWCKQCFITNKQRYMINANDIALYDTFSKRLNKLGEYTTSIIDNDLVLLGVKCKECGKIFSPGRKQVYERIGSIENKRRGNNFFFCTNDCKNKSKAYNDLTTSKFENQIFDCVNNLYSGYIIRNDRSLLVNPKTNKSLELDMYFPKLSKAIECNGSYWHSKSKVIYRDYIKKQLCYKLGIKLLVINEEMWYSDPITCENIITNFINRS